MDVIRQHKGLVAIALLLVALVGVSAINSGDNETRAVEEARPASTESKEEKPAEEKKTENKEKSDDKESTNNTSEATVYEYVAQPGDTYSELARKAVQTYGIVNDVNLSLAQIVAAETKLSNAAGVPLLSEGSSVTIDKSDVVSAIEYAQSLSNEQENLWAAYVPYVDFDTRDNGEK